jgi:hypothetical protein
MSEESKTADISSEYIFGITIEYDGQAENMIAKCNQEPNAFMIASYIMNATKQNPIVRIINLKTEECIGAYQREVKELEKKSAAFE